MENASKALIIAGAILLSILLISLGILVYNNAKGTVEEADLSDQEIATYNAKFTSFLGDNKSAETVKQLVETAASVMSTGGKFNNTETYYRYLYFESSAKAVNTAADKREKSLAGTKDYAINIIKNKVIIENQVYKIEPVYFTEKNVKNKRYIGLIKGFWITPSPWK